MTSPEIYAFATGYHTKRTAGSVQVAWLLENVALDDGWRVGQSLGSEADFIERFETSRDVVRGAIRLVESRGFMRMQRGCKGGLQVVQSNPNHAAGAVAAYLCASGYSKAKLGISMQTVTPLLRELGCLSLVSELCDSIVKLITEGTGVGPIKGARAEVVVTRLLRQVARPIPAAGVPLGSESGLREQFGIGHRTFRQALCILDDLGMLQVKRGRGGGYLLKPPAAIGVIRRIFVLLVTQGAQVADVEPIIWALGIAELRLVFQRMAEVGAGQRIELCDRLVALNRDLTGMRRWVSFKKGLTEVADDLLLSTLTSSMLAYIGRIDNSQPADGPLDRRLLAAEEAILQALRDGRAADAECHLRTAQGHMTRPLES